MSWHSDMARRRKKNAAGGISRWFKGLTTFNETYIAVSGGFCDSYGPAAPFGEGAIFAFAEGKEFLFRIQYGWRPKSAIEQRVNIPWRIDPETARKYVEAIKATSLCNGPAQPMCSGK
jgi:hypothetical protein